MPIDDQHPAEANPVRRWTLVGVGLGLLAAVLADRGGHLVAMGVVTGPDDFMVGVVAMGSMIVGGVVAREIAMKRFKPDPRIRSSDTRDVTRRFHRDAERSRRLEP